MANKRSASSIAKTVACVSPEKKVKTEESTTLLELPSDLVEAQVVRRPSARNKSPYVADAKLVSDGREVLVHMPALDMGGKAGPGRNMMLRLLRDKHGQPVGPDAKGQYDTPKCEFAAQLCQVEEPETLAVTGQPKVWIGAHPKLGEDLAEKLISTLFPDATNIRKQVTIIPGTRLDFALDFESEKKKSLLLEVKTVVDTDYDPNLENNDERSHLKKLFYGNANQYSRAAIFPWGDAKQKTPQGEKCVSARAVKHLRDLIELQKKNEYNTAVLFVVVRDDVISFRPNHDSCPLFARVLHEAQEAGVRVLAHRIRWEENQMSHAAADDDNCNGTISCAAFDAGSLPVDLSSALLD